MHVGRLVWRSGGSSAAPSRPSYSAERQALHTSAAPIDIMRIDASSQLVSLHDSGVKVKKGDKAHVRPPEGYVLTVLGAAIEPLPGSNAVARLYVETENSDSETVKVLLCTLRSPGAEQARLDSLFGWDCDTVFSVEGNGALHLQGYMNASADVGEDDEDEYEDSDDEDEEGEDEVGEDEESEAEDAEAESGGEDEVSAEKADSDDSGAQVTSSGGSKRARGRARALGSKDKRRRVEASGLESEAAVPKRGSSAGLTESIADILGTVPQKPARRFDLQSSAANRGGNRGGSAKGKVADATADGDVDSRAGGENRGSTEATDKFSERRKRKKQRKKARKAQLAAEKAAAAGGAGGGGPV